LSRTLARLNSCNHVSYLRYLNIAMLSSKTRTTQATHQCSFVWCVAKFPGPTRSTSLTAPFNTAVFASSCNSSACCAADPQFAGRGPPPLLPRSITPFFSLQRLVGASCPIRPCTHCVMASCCCATWHCERSCTRPYSHLCNLPLLLCIKPHRHVCEPER
jgi:hypothetical protein